ncbi:MAG: TIGR01244 family sulfur transferase [Rhizobiaceae bacterium]
MEIRRIDDGFAVAGQIGPQHVEAIAQAGFKSLVCNRPDTEEGAVAHGEIEDMAKAAGLEWRFIPVVSGAMTQQDVVDMGKALDELPQPVLAYCRSGARCANLYLLVQQMRGQA